MKGGVWDMKRRAQTIDLNTILLRSAAVLLLLVLISTSIVSGRYARYASAASSQDGARIAAYVFDLHDTSGQYIDISDITKPGDSVTYSFTVTNKNDTWVSEVSENYQITMELRGSLPLSCQLSGNGETLTATGVYQVKSGTEYNFQASTETAHSYTLTVLWPAEQNDLKYANAGLAELVLYVRAEQVD